MSSGFPLSARVENETPGVRGLMTFEADSGQGLIRTLGTGFWSLDQVRRFFARYVACVHDLHRVAGNVITIADMRDSAAQSRETVELLRESVATLYRPGDRVAMVVPNSLAKMQMRRTLDPAYHQFFLSIRAAESWALARRVSPAVAPITPEPPLRSSL